MLASRLVSFPVLLAVAAGCAASGARTSVTPERGPVARIHATYSGGLTQRSLRASFTVDRSAYVLVGHLGGDGVIEILYPENARESNFVQRGTTYQVGPVAANYDGVPQLFSYTTRAFRSPGARTDSYDGRGNGFVFIIASREPLYLYYLQENGYWNNDYEVEDYSWTSDPRTAIKYFADGVARGFPYTLKYANSFGTNALTSYASQQWDCNLLSNMFGRGSTFFEPGFGYWGSGLSSLSWHFYRPFNYYSLANTSWYSMYGAAPGCGPLYSQYSLGFRRPRWSYSPTYYPTAPTSPAPSKPRTGAFDGTRRAPGFRNGSESGPALTLSGRRTPRQPEPATQPSWTPSRRTREPESYRPSTPAVSHSSPRAPVHDATPRMGSPAPSRAPAASAPAPSSPPPKVQASVGKPREP